MYLKETTVMEIGRPTNIRLGRKWMTAEKRTSLVRLSVNSCIVQAPKFILNLKKFKLNSLKL